ncbi:30S ribosomal protein S2 [Patescibacteria group bacterium]|nr:MAG: 30S ribosomal protein S2 [Patescibacteria group bacterium]
MADQTIKQLLEAGAHFGHQTRRWNPQMRPYIFGARSGIHVIDLTQTAEQLEEAEKAACKIAEDGGSVLFVGTKRQAQAIIKKEAEAAGMPYVTERWLGGLLTNFRTIRSRVERLKELEAGLESGDFAGKYNKKEVLDLTNEKNHLERIFGGIKKMDELPKAVFVVDMTRDHIAIAEARNLGLTVIGVADSNANPDLADYPIAANDDAIKSIQLITGRIAAAVAEGAKLHAQKAPVEDAKEDTKKEGEVK